MTTTASSSLGPDRLIWLPLFALMAVALVAGQARANLHVEARSAPAAAFDDAYTAEAWCRMQLDILTGDEVPVFDQGYGSESASAFAQALPSLRRPEGRRLRPADASL